MKLTEQMTFRTTTEILTAIKKMATESGTTASQVINELLTKALGINLTDESQELREIREMLMKHEQWISQAETERREMVKK